MKIFEILYRNCNIKTRIHLSKCHIHPKLLVDVLQDLSRYEVTCVCVSSSSLMNGPCLKDLGASCIINRICIPLRKYQIVNQLNQFQKYIECRCNIYTL